MTYIKESSNFVLKFQKKKMLHSQRLTPLGSVNLVSSFATQPQSTSSSK